jgi:methyl-accepting chemotaxis protein
MKVSNLRIGTRLGTGFALVLVLLLVLAGVAIFSLNTIETVNNRIIKEDWVKVEAAHTIDALTREGVSVFLWARRFNNFIPEPA